MVWLEKRAKDDPAQVVVDRAPPVRVVAVISLFCVILDLFADIILAIRFGQVLKNFYSPTAIRGVYFYWFFTAISCLTFIIEVWDIILTLKNNQENRILTPLAKSLALVFEEVPLPICLYIIYSNEPRSSLAQPALLASCIKLVALIWGIVKFIKMRFCWFFYPCIHEHGTTENIRRCFVLQPPYKIAMLIVNICHVISIVMVIININIASDGGRSIIYHGD